VHTDGQHDLSVWLCIHYMTAAVSPHEHLQLYSHCQALASSLRLLKATADALSCLLQQQGLKSVDVLLQAAESDRHFIRQCSSKRLAFRQPQSAADNLLL